MLLSPDAFVHVPMLSGKIVEPEKSTFRVSSEYLQAEVNHETEIPWMREMIGYAYTPLFGTVLTPEKG